MFPKSVHPFSGPRYFSIRTFQCILNMYYRISNISHFLSQGVPGGNRVWTPASATVELSAVAADSQTSRPWSFSCRLSKATSFPLTALPYQQTHSHTQAWCYLVSLSPPLPVTLYLLKSQSREKVRREIAGACATVKNLNIGHTSD